MTLLQPTLRGNCPSGNRYIPSDLEHAFEATSPKKGMHGKTATCAPRPPPRTPGRKQTTDLFCLSTYTTLWHTLPRRGRTDEGSRTQHKTQSKHTKKTNTTHNTHTEQKRTTTKHRPGTSMRGASDGLKKSFPPLPPGPAAAVGCLCEMFGLHRAAKGEGCHKDFVDYYPSRGATTLKKGKAPSILPPGESLLW